MRNMFVNQGVIMGKIKYLFIIVSILAFGSTRLSAQGMKVRVSDDLELTKLPGNAYIHTSYMKLPGYGRVPANGLVYFTRDSAYIVDTPWNDAQTRELIFWIRKNLDVNIAGVIVTHSHNDCMGGLNEIHRRGIKTYSSELTSEIAARNKLPVPENTFGQILRLGTEGSEIVAGYYGAGHTADNIVVWVPSEKILFGGCLVKTFGARDLGNISEADLDRWPHTLKKLLELYPGAKVVIPGHGSHGGIELIRHTIELLKHAD
jgi:metallo-beta-lactamase class B